MVAERLGQKTVIVGAGPVGCLAALYAARQGDDVEVYELRNGRFSLILASDLMLYSYIDLKASCEILRGLGSLDALNDPTILKAVHANTVPIYP
ncbi:hypothetical protein BDV25DRAFT_138441 [Aspergillus avenaceus]|uniref:FAD-binding domain-containing protein n=1 Tax=Aspergillus avenaceus TaxID=36643 RepID=A0A5N6TZR3_ASPAV|nr:hypothetical protein BDV25DRAFT_138441 [Aspergillus avenaceus]